MIAKILPDFFLKIVLGILKILSRHLCEVYSKVLWEILQKIIQKIISEFSRNIIKKFLRRIYQKISREFLGKLLSLLLPLHSGFTKKYSRRFIRSFSSRKFSHNLSKLLLSEFFSEIFFNFSNAYKLKDDSFSNVAWLLCLDFFLGSYRNLKENQFKNSSKDCSNIF